MPPGEPHQPHQRSQTATRPHQPKTGTPQATPLPHPTARPRTHAPAPLPARPPARPQARYQGSDEERSELLRYYTQFGGRMAVVFDHLMCSDADLDAHRLMDVLEEAIKKGEGALYAASLSICLVQLRYVQTLQVACQSGHRHPCVPSAARLSYVLATGDCTGDEKGATMSGQGKGVLQSAGSGESYVLLPCPACRMQLSVLEGALRAMHGAP